MRTRRQTIKLIGLTTLTSTISIACQQTSEPPPTPKKPSNIISPLKSFEYEIVTVDRQGKIIEKRTLQTQYYEVNLGSGIKIDMVKIPGGTFLMGDPNTSNPRDKTALPSRQVSLPSFFISKYPVTQAQWEAIADLPPITKLLPPNPSEFKGANKPVDSVYWKDAREYCARLTHYTKQIFRLPSEAEWEYACRANTQTYYYFGDTITPELANYLGDNPNHYLWDEPKPSSNEEDKNQPPKGFRGETIEVGQFPPNPFGLYDMHGNISEWCMDTWHFGYIGAPTNQEAWIENSDDPDFRVTRGGSWNTTGYGCGSYYRSQNRAKGFTPTLAWTTANIQGFRLVAPIL